MDRLHRTGSAASENMAVIGHVFNTVIQIIRQKREAGKEPSNALFIADIVPAMPAYRSEEIKAALNALCKQRFLRYGRTMNDVYFILAEENNADI